MSYEVKRSETVGSRLDLAELLNHHKMVRAVEIGTDRGVFASQFLRRWRGEQLYCVDPYLPYTEMNHDRTPDLMMAVHNLAPHSDRCRILRMTSDEAAKLIPKGWAQFIYIDGAHDFESVKKDMRTWWDMVDEGGIIAGHDYDNEHPGVMRAVTEFAQSKHLVVWTCTDFNAPPSWWIHRTQDR